MNEGPRGEIDELGTPYIRGRVELVINLTSPDDEESRGTPREAGGPRTKGKARVAAVRSLPMQFTSDIYCRRLTCDRCEVIS